MASQQTQLNAKDVELAVKLMIDHMAESLAGGERIEIRGLAAFHCITESRVVVAIPRLGIQLSWRASLSPTLSPAKNSVSE